MKHGGPISQKLYSQILVCKRFSYNKRERENNDICTVLRVNRIIYSTSRTYTDGWIRSYCVSVSARSIDNNIEDIFRVVGKLVNTFRTTNILFSIILMGILFFLFWLPFWYLTNLIFIWNVINHFVCWNCLRIILIRYRLQYSSNCMVSSSLFFPIHPNVWLKAIYPTIHPCLAHIRMSNKIWNIQFCVRITGLFLLSYV